MKRALVGTHLGKRVINWPTVLLLGLVVGLVSGGSAIAFWSLLTGEVTVMEVFLPVALCLGFFIGHAIRDAYDVPADRLPTLD
jgi:hypothetical protein